MNDFIDKLLSTRITDSKFKIIFFSSVGSMLFASFVLLSQIITIKDSVKTITEQESITVIDESGNVFKKKLYQNNIDIATIFGITYIKKSLNYGYLNYNNIVNFIKTFSSKEVTDNYIDLISKSLKQLKVLNGTYISKINNYKIINKEGSNEDFEMFFIVTQELVSEAKSERKRFFAKISISFREPTVINSSGLFVTDYKLEIYDEKVHADIFKTK